VLRSLNPSRELRRFESFTCHQVFEGPLTSGNAGKLLHRRRWETAHPARGSRVEVVLGAWACGGHAGMTQVAGHHRSLRLVSRSRWVFSGRLV